MSGGGGCGGRGVRSEGWPRDEGMRRAQDRTQAIHNNRRQPADRRWRTQRPRSPDHARPPAGARCGKAARRDLCGGQGAIPVPTATVRFRAFQRVASNPKQIKTLLCRILLIWTQSGGAHDPGVRDRVCLEGLDRSPPAQIAREVLGGDAMEAPHPLLQPAVVGVHVVDMEIWRLWLRRAGVRARHGT